MSNEQVVWCRFFWGSHGCDLPDGHEDMPHMCGGSDDPCSEYDEEKGAARFALFTVYADGSAEFATWSDWAEMKGWRQ